MYMKTLISDPLTGSFLDIHYAEDWIPLTWISHAIDYAIWGLDPVGHHLTNNILHALNTFLVVLLIMRMVGAVRTGGVMGFSASRPERMALIAAGVTGLLFGIHPIHVESVAWVAERRDVLYAPFFILSLMMYERYVTSVAAVKTPPSRLLSRAYLMSAGFFLLALMSKPMAVSLPVVLLILDWFPFQRIRTFRSFRSAFFEKIPFIALALLSSVLTVMAKSKEIELRENIDLVSRLLVAVKSLIMYLWKMLFPHPLNPLYAYPKEVSFSSFEYFFPLLLAAAITIACVIVSRRQRLWLAVWSFYVVTLLPVSGIVQVGYQSMADRYTYIPGIGPFLLAGLFSAWVAARVDASPPRRHPVRFAAASLGVVLLGIFSLLTVKQIQIWKNTIVLFSHVIEVSREDFFLSHYIRGYALKEAGHFGKAIEDFTRAVSLNPLHHRSYYHRAESYEKTDRSDKAIEDYTRAIASGSPLSSFQSYYRRGLVFSERGEIDRAISDFEKVVEMNPGDYAVLTRLGVLYAKSGSMSKAIETLGEAINIKSDYPVSYGNRGHAYSLIGENEKAIEDFSRAIALDSGYVKAYVNRGNLYLASGRERLAAEDFQKACALGDGEACRISRTLKNSLHDER
jgi:Tfp pilus assembly protein PilF